MRPSIRAYAQGATWFFTLTLQDRRSAALVEHIGHLRACVAQVKSRHPFRIDAMVVLPEHLHALWTLPPEDARHALRWMLIRRGFTRRLLAAGLLDPVASGQRGATERALWQPRCWAHPIHDETDFSRHVDYIHFNPVQHGLVERAADWPYSSFHRFVRQGLLEPDWRLASPAGEGWFGE